MYKYNPLLENKFSQMSDTLYKDLFSEVYNKLHSELLSNVKLGLAVNKPVSGQTVLKKNLILAIPENEHTIIYHTSLSDIAGVIYTNKISPYYRSQWINSVELMTNDNLTIDIKTIDGIVIPHSSIYIKSSLTNNNVLYISITSKMLSDLNLDYKQDFYITIYINNILEDKNTTKKSIFSYNYRKNNLSDKNILLSKIANENIDNDYTFIYINGYLYKPNNYLDIIDNLSETDPLYIDFIQDYNIQKSYTLYDINQSIDDLIYNDINGKSYILLHTDKYIIDNSIYTLDTIDLFIFNNSFNQGLFIPSIGNENINQIDSANISISLDYLNTFISKLQNDISDNFNLEIKYRIYNKDNKLDYNSIYTNLLYKYCGDNDIEKYLLSKNDDNVLNKIYNSNKLESSLYTKTLYKLLHKRNYFEIFNTSINTYGYFRFCQKYCYSFYTIKIEDINIKTYTLEKSLFYKNEFVYLKIYKNKILINNSDFIFTESKDIIEITFLNVINKNDLFYVQLLPCDKSYNQIIKHQLINNLNTDNTTISNIYNKNTFLFDWINSDYRSFTVDNDNNQLLIKFNTDDNNYNYDFYKFNIYLKEDIPSDEFTYLDKKLPYRYIKIDNLEENDYFSYIENNISYDKSFLYNFKSNSYGKSFLIVPNNYYTLHIKEDNIKILDNDILVIDLKYNNEYIVDIPNLVCYLNGYYLYNDIDYKITKIKNNDNSISGYQLHIQNYYRRIPNNRIDIFISTIDKLDTISKKGYGIENILISDNKINYNDNENTLELLIDGKIYNDINKKILSNIIKIDDFIYNLPYEINYIIPSIIQKNYYEDNFINKDDSYIMNKLLQPTSTGPFNTKLYDIKSYKEFNTRYTNLNDSLRQIRPYSDFDNTLKHLYSYSITDSFNIFNYLINIHLNDDTNNVIEIDIYKNLENNFYNKNYLYQFFNYLISTSLDDNNNNTIEINVPDDLENEFYTSNYLYHFFNYLIDVPLDSSINNVMEIDIYNGLPKFIDRTKYVYNELDNNFQDQFYNKNDFNKIYHYLINDIELSKYDQLIEIYTSVDIPYRYIYSTYLIYIINKIINNEFSIDCFKSDREILNSLSKFDYLKKYDIIFDVNNRILNYKYIIYPDTNNIDKFTSNKNHINMIKRIINIIKSFYITM